MKRRNFIEYLSLGSLAGLANWQNLAALNTDYQPIANDPQPTSQQKAWMDMGFGLFIHFGINTYYDVEWSDGTLDPAKFNPTKLDTDQWCRSAKAAGMQYVVLITKHHDGFCLWPTKYTDYSVASTPWKGDLVAQVVNSAEKYGLKVGFYYSLWDRHEPSHDEDEPRYVDFMKMQLEELLTQYGDVVELWFDGFWKKQQHGWTKKDTAKTPEEKRQRHSDFIQAWRSEGAYRWQMDHLYQFIKALQPDCLVMNNATTAYAGVPLHPVDIRSGERYTQAAEDQKVWPWLGKDIYLPLQIETTMSTTGEQFKSGNWFWHADDDSVVSKAQVQDYLAVAKKMQANLLLNAGPTAEGKLRELDEKLLLSLGD